MPDQLYIGNFRKGLTDDDTAFNIDNDAFPFLFNFYTWRGRCKRKRGTVLLGRLQRQIELVASPPSQPWQFSANLTLSIINLFGVIGLSPTSIFIANITQASQAVITYVPVVGSINYQIGQIVQVTLVAGMTALNDNYYRIVGLGVNSITIDVNTLSFPAYGGGGLIAMSNGPSIVPGSINLVVGANTYTEPVTPNGTLVGNPAGSGLIYYTTGIVVISGGAGSAITGTFSYFPDLPVMGLRDFTSTASSSNYPLLVAFDTKYAYQCTQSAINTSFFSVSYYKITNNPVVWNGANYQQFWTTNYPSTTTNQSGAFWATNNVPGFHFNPITNIIRTGQADPDGTVPTPIPAGQTRLFITSHGLIVGDRIWVNEVQGMTQINGSTLTVATVVNTNKVDVTLDSTAYSAYTSGGIAQYLTSSISGEDGIRWYDGDMTGQTGIPTSSTTGWVNFAPPLTATTVSINGLPAALYYLVGALAIVPFKDRLLFFSPYIQTSTGQPVQLQDTVIWSWSGTPFYNSLVPNNQTFASNVYYVDQTGLGGYLSAGISKPIQTVTDNEDVLLVGFGGNGRKTRFAYTGNDFQPFLFYNINSELPSTSTFSSIVLDKGAIDIGSFGIAMTDQQSSQRIDLDIPNAVFQIQKDNNGAQRVSAIRDYINEWISFCYPVDNIRWVFPTQTFFFNYRDNTWAIFYENFTAHGNYRANENLIWANLPYQTWGEWSDPWNTGTETALEVQVIGGNPQGYVLIKGIGTGEGISGYISALSNDGNGNTQITSFNHCLLSNNPNTFTTDFIYIEGVIGTNASDINNAVYAVKRIIDENNFVVEFPFNANDYLGGGQYRKLSHPKMQTKQFPFYWQQGRKVILGVQRYLFSKTADGEVTVNIYLSQDADDPWNNPDFSGIPNGLEYSQIISTALEPNNLQMQVGEGQQQLWHRVNTSLIGDTVQLGISLSDTQMLDVDIATDEIILHGIQLTVMRGPDLA